MQVHEKVGKSWKVAIHCVFPMICGSRGSKSRLAKAAGAEPAGQMRDEKLHAVVAPSTFPSQNVPNTPCLRPLLKVEMLKKCTLLWREAPFPTQKCTKHWPCFGPLDHFWKLRCRKSAHRCGGKHISKSKRTKHTMSQTTFESWDVEKVHVVVARSTFPTQKCTKHLPCSWPFLQVAMSKKSTPVVARSTFPRQKCQKLWRF